MNQSQYPQFQRPIPTQAYTSDGRPVQAEIYPPRSGLGASFSGLIGKNVLVPTSGLENVVTETAPTKKRKKKEKEDSTEQNKEAITPVSSKEIVESTVYADTYSDTNNMTLGIIGQTDELLRDCKQELDYLRAQRNLKGRYHYINATVESMSSLLSTKLSAIKEINNTIKTVNDNEYRRFKDMRALESTDDNKAVMDAYAAFISAPVGVPEYRLPGTANLTGGLDGVVRADYPPEIQAGMDAGMANYLANLSPEENLMLQDSNKDIEEVIIYDQATGARKFQWMNTRTGEYVSNMPISSELTLGDYSIDTRMGIAKNTNLNTIKKVITTNSDTFSKF